MFFINVPLLSFVYLFGTLYDECAARVSLKNYLFILNRLEPLMSF